MNHYNFSFNQSCGVSKAQMDDAIEKLQPKETGKGLTILLLRKTR